MCAILCCGSGSKPRVTIVTPSSDLEISNNEEDDDENIESTKVPASESGKEVQQGTRAPVSVYISSTKAKIEKKKAGKTLSRPSMRGVSEGGGEQSKCPPPQKKKKNNNNNNNNNNNK